jgi:hypothetical protein
MTHLAFLPQFPLPSNPLALFGVLLLAGALGGELIRRVLNLPRITGYVLIGGAGRSRFNVLDRMLGYTRAFLDVVWAGAVRTRAAPRFRMAQARPLAGSDGAD